jgi:hypothetical protein
MAAQKKRKTTTRKEGVRKKAARKAAPPPPRRGAGARRRELGRSKFAQLWSGAPRGLKTLANRLHELVLAELDGAEETVYVDWGVFALEEEVCGIQPGPDFVKLYFQRAVELSDRSGLLEGVGKNIRHVKLYPDDAFPEGALKKLLAQARKLDG